VQEAAKRTKTSNDLKQLALAYIMFNDDKKRGPSEPDEWLKSPSAADPQVKQLIELTRPGGQFVFAWNVKLTDLAKAGGVSNTVLGYESKAPTAGGQVVMADGAVRMVTADEFKALAKPAETKGK